MGQKQNKNESGWDKTRQWMLLLGTILSFYIVIISIFFSGDLQYIINLFYDNFIPIINKYPYTSLSLILFSLFITLSMFTISMKKMLSKEENHFLEADEEKIKINREAQDVTPASEGTEKVRASEKNFYSYFCKYVDRNLEGQIIMLNIKASYLLQEGKICITFGFFYYFGVILFWHFFLTPRVFEYKYIYGMGASSSLFLFIEFFGAWFLRQYKQFVDTATYLVKIKSILHRYILAYLVLKDGNEKGFDPEMVVAILKEEIKWPETYLLKHPDINFAKECMETATNLLNSLPINNKNEAK